MSDEEKRIKIAEACGWKHVKNPPKGSIGPHITKAFVTIENCDNNCIPIPNYLNDLNAMHEAEECLASGFWEDYEKNLRDICGVPRWGGWHVIHATARQRAEAFLKTIEE